MLRSYFKEKYLKLFIRIILGLVFVVAGVFKLFGPGEFMATIQDFTAIDFGAVKVLTYTLILFEITLGAFILLKPGRKVMLTTACTLVVFGAFLGYKVITHDPSTCGCFGNVMLMSNQQALTKDLVMLLGTIYLT